jgi:hypothetical protein
MRALVSVAWRMFDEGERAAPLGGLESKSGREMSRKIFTHVGTPIVLAVVDENKDKKRMPRAQTALTNHCT